MPSKQITNPLQAFTAGATWATLSGDNEMTQTVANLLNGSGVTLYTGDIVCLDVTGTQAVLAASAGDPRIIGTVGATYNDGSYVPQSGGISNMTLRATGGGFVPPELSAVVGASMGFTGASGTTVTYSGAAAVDLGKQIIVPYNSSTNANPQVYTITAVTVGTSYTVTPGFNGTTGTYLAYLQNAPSAIGPGWGPASVYPIGVEVPIVMQGYGRVNINAVAAVVATDAISSTSGSPVGARTAAGAAVAAQNGTFIAVTLEAYSARDTSLTTAGISGHDSVRAIISKF
jgi:hypothetical protein